MTIDGVIIPGKRGRILCSYFRPDEPEENRKQPVVILCHGFPGNDKFLDFAYILQERGYHVMAIEYSGCWGSDGAYSLSNIIEDINTSLDWLLEQPDESVDKRRIYLLCHSMGGFGGVNVFASRPELAGAVFMSPANITDMYRAAAERPDVLEAFVAQMDEFCRMLNGVNAEKIIDEVRRDGERFRFENVADGFGTRPVLLVRGTQDTVTPSRFCVDVLKEMQDRVPGSRCETVTFDAPHDYLNVRHELRRCVVEFLEQISGDN